MRAWVAATTLGSSARMPIKASDIEKTAVVGEFAGKLPAVQHVELSLQDGIEQRLIALHPIDCALEASPVSIGVGKDCAAPAAQLALIDCPVGVTGVRDASQPFQFMKAAVGERVGRATAASPRCGRQRPAVARSALRGEFLPRRSSVNSPRIQRRAIGPRERAQMHAERVQLRGFRKSKNSANLLNGPCASTSSHHGLCCDADM